MKDTLLLEVREIDACYGHVRALRHVSLHVCRGEVVALIGANGAGKTTLLMSIFGAPRATCGSISFAGTDISRAPTSSLAQMGLALVPEGRRIFPAMTVLENLVLGATPRRRHSVDLSPIYEMFPILRARSEQRAGTLSGGEQQMLAIGRALMSDPTLLLLDEPSLGLAPLVTRQIYDTLKAIASGGTTILLVEQNAQLALEMADRAYVLANGEIRLSGSARDLLADESVRSAYLGET